MTSRPSTADSHLALGRRGRPLKVLLSSVVLAMVAAACSSASTTSTPKPAGGASGAPKYGGTLVVALPDPGQLNPGITTSGLTHQVTGQIFNGLVRLDEKLVPQPDLATSWKASDDNRTYTVNLAQGVRWHDGQTFSSADVKFTFENVLVKFSQRTLAAVGPILDGIDTPDANTVVFRFKQSYPPFMSLVDEDNAPILPKHLYEGTDPFTNPANAKPVGTGPFRFDSKADGDRITLVRNPAYFKDGQPYLDRIVFRLIANPVQALQAFQAGEINLLSPIPPQVDQLKSMPGAVVTEKGRLGFSRVIRLIPNLRRKPFNDVRARQAIAFSIDRDLISKTVYAGLFKPATGPITSGLDWAYTADVAKYPRDVAKAKALLDDAGLKPGPDGVRLRTPFLFDQGFAPVADILKQELGEVGIVLDLQLVEFNTWVQKVYLQWDFDLGYSQLTDIPDPDFAAKSVFTCASIVKVPFVNAQGYCNDKVDSLFAQASGEADRSKRAVLYRQAQQIIVEDQPQIFLVDGIGPWAFSSDFKGIDEAGAKSPYYFGHTAWWTKGSAERPKG